MKVVFLFIFVVIFGGIAGYLHYLYFEKKSKKRLNKKESILTSIFTFMAITTASFFIIFTENYFYMFLISISIIIGTGLILGLLLRWVKIRENKHKDKENAPLTQV